jgi:large subunit ribosomal protein L4
MAVKKSSVLPAGRQVVSRQSSDKKAAVASKPAIIKTAKAPMVIKVETKPGSLNVPVLSLTGAPAGTLSLPKEIFGEKVNKALLAQAVRVYSTNQTAHFGSNKTRGEVIATTKKIYRQKGTGGARHGAKSAPIYVGGGVTFASKYRKTILDLPKKMKKAALIAALASKVESGEIVGLEGLEKASGKTKQMANLLKGLEKRSALIVNDQKSDSAARAVSNLAGVTFVTVDQLNAFEIIRHQSLLLTKAAVDRLQSGKSEDLKSGKSENAEVKTEKPKTVASARRVK